jgi:hypothetical protein
VGSLAPGAPSALRRVAASLAAAAAASCLAGCGGPTSVPAPKPGSPAERAWLEGAGRFVAELQSDLFLSASGGANLATARRAMHDQNDVYTMLVAYNLFGDCNRELADVGVPERQAGQVVTLIVSACRHLEHATTLFQAAMTREDPAALLAATRTAAAAAPLLAEARSGLAELGSP